MIVLHVGPSPRQIGGMETFVGDLLHSSLAQKHTLYLLDISKPKLRKGGCYAIPSGYAVFRRIWYKTLLSYSYSLWFFGKFLGLLSVRKIDIVHIHTASFTSFWEKCAYITAAKLVQKKIILHIQLWIRKP